MGRGGCDIESTFAISCQIHIDGHDTPPTDIHRNTNVSKNNSGPVVMSTVTRHWFGQVVEGGPESLMCQSTT
jgi:hypothetical protein